MAFVKWYFCLIVELCTASFPVTILDCPSALGNVRSKEESMVFLGQGTTKVSCTATYYFHEM